MKTVPELLLFSIETENAHWKTRLNLSTTVITANNGHGITAPTA